MFIFCNFNKNFFIILGFTILGFSKNIFAYSNQNNDSLIKHSLQIGGEGIILSEDQSKQMKNFYNTKKTTTMDFLHKGIKFEADACLTYLYNFNTLFGMGLSSKFGYANFGQFYIKETTLNKDNFVSYKGFFLSPSLRFNFNFNKI